MTTPEDLAAEVRGLIYSLRDEVWASATSRPHQSIGDVMHSLFAAIARLAAQPAQARVPLTQGWIDRLSQQNGWDGGDGAPGWLVDVVRQVERAHGIKP